MTDEPSGPELAAELEDLRARLAEAEEVLSAIRNGEVDAVVVAGERGEQVYTLSGADRVYRQLIETMSEGAVTLSADGVILYGNVRLAEMLGRPLDQVLGTALRNYLPPSDQQALDAILAQARTAPSRREINLKTSEGRLAPVYLSAARLQSEGTEMVFCLVLTDLTEQKSLQRITAEQRLSRLVLEQAAEAIVVCGEQGRVIRASQAAQQFCDGSPLLRPFAEAFPLRTDASDPFHLAPVLQGETLRNVDVALDRQGQKLDLLLNAGPLLSGRQILGCVITLTDITERKRAEEALRESEEKYRTLVENASESILIAQDGRLKFVNRMASDISGYSEQELCSRPFLEFIQPGDRDMVEQYYMKRLKGNGVPPRYAFRLIHKDGSIRWMEIDAVLIVWEGKPATLNFLSDITERKRMEVELSQAEGNFRLSLEESPLGIRIVSIDGKVLYANRAILDLYGYDDVEELRSTPVKKRYTPASYTEFQLRKKKRMNGEDYPSKYEISIITKTGEIRHLQVFRKEILWDGQKQFQAIYQDITEHKKAEDKLRETLSGLHNALSGIIQVLSAVSEKRDPYTAGHQRRVADLAQAIAQKLGLPPDRVEGIRVAGVIHDIGKLSIPAEILSKPARLSEIEYKMIQSHAQVGHDILGEVKFVWPIAKMILQHHERMDGSGYPQGLKGDDILLESRILAVSDVIEAMASHRPYRAALGIEAALKEIENNKGLLYDPAVVSACLTLFREKGYALND